MNISLLRRELEEVLRTEPPLATRRHETPENLAWLGRAANAIERWDPAKAGAFADLNRQFQSRNAHEANEAFRQMIVILQQAHHDLGTRARVAALEGHLSQLRAQDEILQKASKQEIPLPVSGLLIRLFKEIGEGFPELNLPAFEGHGHATVLRSQVSAAIQKISGVLTVGSTDTTAPTKTVAPTTPDLVFVIHGRQLQEEFHAFLRAIGLKPLEWSDARRRTGKPNPFTWEIVDRALTEAGAIVALLTPDDEARLAKHLWAEHENALEKERLLQPRQNVLFEAGVAYGRAPERTVLIRIGSHRPMSDLAGHHILQLDDSPQSRQAVADALRSAGCPVDLSGNDWFRAGRFATTEGQIEAERAATSDGDQTGTANDSQTLAPRMLFEEADYLHRVYRGLDQDDRDRVRLPLFSASWPEFGKEWDFVHVSLYSHAHRVDRLVRSAQAVWSEMKWPTAPVELFRLSANTTMADLLHALEEFRHLLRTKFS